MPNVDLYTDDRVTKSTGNNWLVEAKGMVENNLPNKKRERYIPTINQYRKRHSNVHIVTCTIEVESLPVKFNRLLAEWREESMFMSSMNEMVMLRSYLAIIGMGPSVVPLILNELRRRPAHLFWALEIITGSNPVLPEDEGQLDRMAMAWIKWGQENRLIQ